MKCNNCGSELTEGQKFCSGCGANLSEQSSVPQSPIEPSDVEEPVVTEEPVVINAPVEEPVIIENPVEQTNAYSDMAADELSSQEIISDDATVVNAVEDITPADTANMPEVEAVVNATPVSLDKEVVTEGVYNASGDTSDNTYNVVPVEAAQNEVVAYNTTAASPAVNNDNIYNTIPAAPVTNANNFNNTNNSNQGYNSYNAASGTDKPKKSKAPIFIIAGILGIVFIAAIASIIAFGGHFFKRNFASPTDYYKYVESRAQKADKMDWYGAYRDRTLSGFGATAEQGIVVELTDEGRERMELLAAGADISWLEKIELKAVASEKDDQYEGSLVANLNDDKLISAEAYMDMESAYVRIPELSEAYISMPIDKVKDYGMDIPAYLESMKNMPTKEELNKLSDAYVDIYLKNIKGVQKENLTVSAAGVTQSAMKLSYNLTGDDLKNLMQEIADKAKDDEELDRVISSFVDMSIGYNTNMSQLGMNTDEIMEEYRSTITDMAENPDDYEFDNMELYMAVYVDGAGNIIGRDTTIFGETNGVDGEINIDYLLAKKGKDVGFSYKTYDAEQDFFEISGTGKLSGTKLTDASFEVFGNGESVMYVDITSLNLAELIKGELIAEMSVGVTYEDLSGTVDLSSYTLDIVSNKDDVIFTVFDGEDALVDITVTEKFSKASDISIPTDIEVYDAETEADKYMETLDIEGFISGLRGTDIPSEYIDQLETLSGYINQ